MERRNTTDMLKEYNDLENQEKTPVTWRSEFSLKTLVIILSWLVTNVGVVISNKYIFKTLDWKYPLSLTAVHMLVCWIGTYIALHVFKRVPYIYIAWNDYLRGILPLSYVCWFILIHCANFRKFFAKVPK